MFFSSSKKVNEFQNMRKSCTYMPYLTLWDKISQNLAHLEANSHKMFKSHRIFRPSYSTFYEEINLHHFVVLIINFIHYNKGFWLFWRSFKVIFIKISQNFISSHLKICLISEISVHSLWHVWPQHDKTNKMTCAASEDSNQAGHLPHLICRRCPHEETFGP